MARLTVTRFSSCRGSACVEQNSHAVLCGVTGFLASVLAIVHVVLSKWGHCIRFAFQGEVLLPLVPLPPLLPPIARLTPQAATTENSSVGIQSGPEPHG
jgi:hypothetical protein